MTKYHHFTFHENGEIKTKLFADSPLCVVHNEIQLRIGEQIEPLEMNEPEGLSLQRQWYLYEKIRNFCFDDRKKDLVTPEPLNAK